MNNNATRGLVGQAVAPAISREALLERLWALEVQARQLLAWSLLDRHFNPRPALGIIREARAIIETTARVAGHISDTTETNKPRPDLDTLILQKLTENRRFEIPKVEGVSPPIDDV